MITYIATNTQNGKFYIGSTTNFLKRQKQHLLSKRNTPFHNSLRKSPDTFVWEVFEDDSDNAILEQSLLDMWFGVEQCYNLSPFSDRPKNNPESSRRWGKINGPIQGHRRHKERTGIFHPDAPRSEWTRKGGQRCKEEYGKRVKITSSSGEEFIFMSIKDAVKSGLIPYMSLKRCLKDPSRSLRSGYTAEYICS